MSVFIKGMEMPKDLGKTITIYPNGTVRVWINNKGSGELLEQRAVPVPPHGRLIDADAFEKANAYFWGKDFINAKYEDCLCDLVNAAPTVIPAEEGNE